MWNPAPGTGVSGYSGPPPPDGLVVTGERLSYGPTADSFISAPKAIVTIPGQGVGDVTEMGEVLLQVSLFFGVPFGIPGVLSGLYFSTYLLGGDWD